VRYRNKCTYLLGYNAVNKTSPVLRWDSVRRTYLLR
jgi:hypothetical protein